MEKLEKYKLDYSKILPMILIKSYVCQEKIEFIAEGFKASLLGRSFAECPELRYKFDCGSYRGKSEYWGEGDYRNKNTFETSTKANQSSLKN